MGQFIIFNTEKVKSFQMDNEKQKKEKGFNFDLVNKHIWSNNQWDKMTVSLYAKIRYMTSK